MGDEEHPRDQAAALAGELEEAGPGDEPAVAQGREQRDVAGLVHLAVMVVVILQGYATVGTGGATLGMAAVAWATRPPERPPRRAGL